MMRKTVWIVAMISALGSSCAGKPAEVAEKPPGADLRSARDRIETEDLLKHIRAPSSDECEGRAPGTTGEEKTVNYLVEQFKRFGLKPGNPDGTYLQQVPLVGITGQPEAFFASGSKRLNVHFPDEYVAVSHRFRPEIRVENSEIVFVGYGVVAREYGWDDYKGVDLKSKTLLMLINDPPVPDPADPSKLDEKMFRGNAMTYYGRWTYKYEIASEKGAAAAIIVHETGPAGYPYEVVASSWGGENFDIRKADKNVNRVTVESWISLDTARRLFQIAGQNFDTLKRAAANRDFKPVLLPAKVNFTLKNKLREVESKNVLARLEGSR